MKSNVVPWCEAERLAWIRPEEKDAMILELRDRLRVMAAHMAAARCLLESCGISEKAGGNENQAPS
jgi:hypothetical protein